MFSTMVEAIREYIYRGRASREISSAELVAILRAARSRNGSSGVTGLLLYGDGDFLHVLEGISEAVESVVGRIRADDRLLHLDVISDRTVGERQFPNWSMAFHPGEDDQPGEGFSTFLVSTDPLGSGSDLSRSLAEAFRRLHP